MLVLLGFLVQWPILLTLAMFSVLVWMCARLARMEEQEVRDQLGTEYDAYASQVPRFIPWRNQGYEEPSRAKSTLRLTKEGARSEMEAHKTTL